jgi:hypothetical protein
MEAYNKHLAGCLSGRMARLFGLLGHSKSGVNDMLKADAEIIPGSLWLPLVMDIPTVEVPPGSPFMMSVSHVLIPGCDLQTILLAGKLYINQHSC